jgi:hypothetical protein
MPIYGARELFMSEEKEDRGMAGLDTYYAYLEDGELVLEPYCSCGNPLDEMYYCDVCRQHRHPVDVLCEDASALKMVEKYIRTSAKFRSFKAMLGKRRTTES